MKRFTFLIAAIGACAALFVPAASAQVEIYTPGGFIYGQNNTVSLRGTVDAPTGGQTIKVRQIDAALSCPTATGTNVPVDFTFTAWVPAGNPVNVANAASGIYSGRRDSRFCIYAYYQYDGLGEANPNVSYSQVVHFSDPPPPTIGVSRLFVASTVNPDRPYFIMSGTNESLGGEAIAFVKYPAGCPQSFPGGNGALSFSDLSGTSFTRYGVAAVGVGFWRACGYTISAGVSTLGRGALFSIAPKGGWKPKYALVKGKAKLKSGRISLGAVKCPGPCDVTVSASIRGKTVATGSTSGSGRVALSIAAGKGAKRGKKTRFKITTAIDQSTASKTVELKLR